MSQVGCRCDYFLGKAYCRRVVLQDSDIADPGAQGPPPKRPRGPPQTTLGARARAKKAAAPALPKNKPLVPAEGSISPLGQEVWELLSRVSSLDVSVDIYVIEKSMDIKAAFTWWASKCLTLRQAIQFLWRERWSPDWQSGVAHCSK